MNENRIFAEVPDDIDEYAHHGTLVGGMAGFYWRNIKLADAYKLAGDILLEQMIENLDDMDEVIYPALFNYRQALEVYLKSCLTEFKNIHDLKILLDGLHKELSILGISDTASEIESTLLEFHYYDSKSTFFRYEDKKLNQLININGEFWVNFHLLRSKMDLVQNYFIALYKRLELIRREK